MQNMLIWICITTVEYVTEQWCTGSNKTLLHRLHSLN